MNVVTEVELPTDVHLEHYEQHAALAPAVAELRRTAARHAATLNRHTVWMVNSTAQGGGVAEMLPTLISLLRCLGVDARWAVINSTEPEYFKLTKHLHNMIHGSGRPTLSASDRDLYEAVSRELAMDFRSKLRPSDVLVIHDPQPAGMGALLKRELGLRAIWRCHIGVEDDNSTARAGWDFLRPYVEPFDHAVFSALAYIPSYLSGNASIVEPTLDPLSEKNRELHPPELANVLCTAGLLDAPPAYFNSTEGERVSRLTANGRFAPLDAASSVGLLFRPTLTQISRWDRLKGWGPLLDGFVRTKRKLSNGYRGANGHTEYYRRSCLVLAGPEPEAVADDPEAREVLEELTTAYRALEPEIQRDVAVLSLPMKNPKANALLVNSLQRCSNVVIQNSVREAFGLVVAEAMWKGTPVLGSAAYGIRQQIRDGVDGILVREPESAAAVEETLLAAFEAHDTLPVRARSARRRAYDRFLIFRQLARWLEVLAAQVAAS